MALIETVCGYHISEIINNHHDFEYSEDKGLTYKPVRRDSFLFRALMGDLIVRKIFESETRIKFRGGDET